VCTGPTRVAAASALQRKIDGRHGWEAGEPHAACGTQNADQVDEKRIASPKGWSRCIAAQWRKTLSAIAVARFKLRRRRRGPKSESRRGERKIAGRADINRQRSERAALGWPQSQVGS